MNDFRRQYREGSIAVKTAFLGLLLALAVLMGYVEAIIPIPMPLPGMKLGLTNLVIAGVLYLLSWKEAYFVSLLRVVIIGFLFGNMFSIIYGISGAALSLLIMTLLKMTKKFGILGVSAAGGVFHNVAQIIVAAAIVRGFPWQWYLPILMLVGLAAGLLIGFADSLVLPRIYPGGEY